MVLYCWQVLEVLKKGRNTDARDVTVLQRQSTPEKKTEVNLWPTFEPGEPGKPGAPAGPTGPYREGKTRHTFRSCSEACGDVRVSK